MSIPSKIINFTRSVQSKDKIGIEDIFNDKSLNKNRNSSNTN